MNVQPDISIITVNYNGFKDTCEMIESVQEHVSCPYELIVVDNGSARNEARLMQEKYPRHIILRSEQNLGFAGGNNLGIRVARGKYIMLLNNDTYLVDDSLQNLCKTLEKHPEIGGVSPKIKFAFPPQRIQYAGFTPFSKFTLRNHTIGYNKADKGQYDTPTPTAFLHGAAMMLKPEVVEETGLMSEKFFLYYEEMDWCSRITGKGYQLWYDPQCTVYHKESCSTGQNSPLKNYYLTRNRLLYTWRHRWGAVLFISLLYQLCISNPKNIIVHLLRREFKQTRAIFKGCVDFCFLKHKCI